MERTIDDRGGGAPRECPNIPSRDRPLKIARIPDKLIDTVGFRRQTDVFIRERRERARQSRRECPRETLAPLKVISLSLSLSLEPLGFGSYRK
jgi:hypothetical protein